ncbi:MAG: DUF302 domain-containing protein [Ilumatobacteraceae bacterium]
MSLPQTTAYIITTTVDLDFDTAVTRVREELAVEGFGVLTEIDVQATLEGKLGVHGEPYLILGACNPALAHQGLEIEPDLGVLLPCNVVVRTDDHAVRVSAMEPDAAMRLAANPALAPLAAEARERLERALSRI